MVDIKMQEIPEKTTDIVYWDKTLIIDSEDWNKTKIAEANKFVGPMWPQWLVWQWAYDNTAQYYINDAVNYNWNSYIAIQDTTGNAPTDTTYWNLLAQKWVWDMISSTYDPNNIAADCFSQDNMENWTTNVNYTKIEQDKLAWIADWANVNVQADYNQTDNTQDDYIKNKPDLSVYEITADKVTAWQTTPDDTHYPSEKLTKDSLDWKEDAFTKNTAFNKDFWTAAWTVMEWDTNVGIVWTKTVDETNIADKTIIQYDSANDKYVCVAPPSWWWIWIAPAARYDWSLTTWVFEEITVPSDFTLNTVKNYLENEPTSWTSTTTDADASAWDTTISVSSVDWFEVWDHIQVWWNEDHTISSIDASNNDITLWEALVNDQASWAAVDRYGRVHIDIDKYDSTNSDWANLTSVDLFWNDPLTNTVDIKDVDVGSDLSENDVLRFNITEVGDDFAGSNLKIYFK